MISLPIDFADAIRASGMMPPAGVKDLGKMTRFCTKTGKIDSGKAGYVTLFSDMQGGVFGDWASGFESVWQSADHRKMNDAERLAFEAKARAAKAEAEREKAQAQAAAKQNAQTRYDNAACYSGTEVVKYALRKRLYYMGKTDEYQQLLLPIRNLQTGELVSVQTIADDGGKRFAAGGAVSGHGLVLTDADTTKVSTLADLQDAPAIYIAEGWATAETVRQAMRAPVIVAFSSGNMPSVASALRLALPDAKIVLCADIGNGQQSAEKAAKLVNGAVVLPMGVHGTDFNDDHVGLLQSHSAADVLAMIEQHIIRQQLGEQAPAVTVMESTKASVPMLNDVPNVVHVVCEDAAAAKLMAEFVDSKRVCTERNSNTLPMKAVMKTCLIASPEQRGKQIEAGIYWVAVGFTQGWLSQAQTAGMQCFNFDDLNALAMNEGLKSVSVTVNKALPFGVGKVAMRPKFHDRSSKGRPLDTLENWEKVASWEGVKLAYNQMMRKVEFIASWQTSERGSDIAATNDLANLVSVGKRFELPTDNIADYHLTLAAKRAYHPVRDWINRHEWDGTSRLQAFVDTLITDDAKIAPSLKLALVLRWAVGAVQAIMSDKPAEQHGVLVLQGAQGVGKTKWFRSLCPIPFATKDGLTLDVKNPDSVRDATSQWLCELGELDGVFRKSDIANLKAFITKASDSYRMPYARTANDYPRRTAFIGTVNETDFLADRTGNRRWWSIPVESIDYDHRVDMQQFWAEIAHLWREGAKWWLDGEDLKQLNMHNTAFEVEDNYAVLVGKGFCFDQVAPFSKPMTSTEVALHIGFDVARIDQKTLKGIGQALRKFGIKDKNVKIKGMPTKCWIMPEPQ